ncbi:neprilysin-1-like [Haliotis rufescens]|uniref:neprilysin-1-like n=1 Tax=Haliotis rufescens TaxID=6454 RepID=UPI001EAFF998|nr:neprilysin-1-like [Haliotis rufescens]XP_046381234.1 neprilysin-1-like [Haliotis rufescens]XP_046381235.1 neprilysin-1-like [Haliotis rufescens]XP_046381236.1 neprilysin-1-like [Haliotis rufescens]XP_048250070.1 neprilysin-1-like [Haliotis rufescens]
MPSGCNLRPQDKCNGGTGCVMTSNHTEGMVGKDVEKGDDPTLLGFLPRMSVQEVPASWWTSREKYLMAVCTLLFLACIAFIAVAFTRSEESKHCLTADCIKTASQLMDMMDVTVNPCEDFYQFACGQWDKTYVIPEEKSSFNTFEKLHDELQIILKGLLEEYPTPHDCEATLKAKVLYRSCINVSQVERVGDTPLREVLESLGGWPLIDASWDPSTFDLEVLLGKLRGKYNAPVLMDILVSADDKNSSVNILQIDQPKLGMPSREYYLQAEDKVYFHAYYKYMLDVAHLLGADMHKAQDELHEVLEFEIKLANVTKPQSERHDTGAIYDKMTIKELQQVTPTFDWVRYFNLFMPYPITEQEPVVVFAAEYLHDMFNTVMETDRQTVVNYIMWRVILNFAAELTESYQHVGRQYRRVLQGVKRDKIRWQKCVEYVNKRMGMAVGSMFIRDNFKKESKDTALEMIHDIREAFNELLEENHWMDEITKSFAKEKANAMNERIGYPDFIKDSKKLDEKYSLLQFDAQQYFRNILRVEEYSAINMMRKLREPVRKDTWEQDPAVVNAFYNPNRNDIVFPAGILQPLFYSRHFPKSLNYGGIGVVIGHEITHGFDDKGRQYDKDGNLKQWWDEDTIQAFRNQAQCMINQYSGYKLEQIGMYLDGKNTQGENIADNGGLKQAYRAYRKWVQEHGEEQLLPGIGLSHNQLFFLNYAQIWCGKMRDEEALHKIRTAVHSPGPLRILGPLSNSLDFAEAYNCPIGSRMNPTKKCSVW